MTEYEYEYYLTFQKWSNTNTNIICFVKTSNYKYEYHYSVSTIWILFEYQNIRSQTHTHIYPRPPPLLLLLNLTLVKYIIVDFWLTFVVLSSFFFFSKIQLVFGKNPQRIRIWILFGLKKITWVQVFSLNYSNNNRIPNYSLTSAVQQHLWAFDLQLKNMGLHPTVG